MRIGCHGRAAFRFADLQNLYMRNFDDRKKVKLTRHVEFDIQLGGVDDGVGSILAVFRAVDERFRVVAGENEGAPRLPPPHALVGLLVGAEMCLKQ